MDKSLTEISIKQPKQYKILSAIAHGLHSGTPLQEIFKALNISNSYGYAVWRRFKPQIEEIRSTLGAGDERPQSDLLTAKKFLQEKSPEFAEIIYNLAKDDKAPARERVQAAKTGLNLAGVGNEKGGDDGGLKDMKLIMAKIYKDCNIIQGKPETTEAIEDGSGQEIIDAEVEDD
jgi:hypothetical protein